MVELVVPRWEWGRGEGGAGARTGRGRGGARAGQGRAGQGPGKYLASKPSQVISQEHMENVRMVGPCQGQV